MIVTGMPTTLRSQSHARRQRLLTLLSDGGFHSGEHLAKRLRISRGGVWKLVRVLRAMGVDVQSVPRQGYRLPRAVDLLDRNAIVDSLPAETRQHLDRLDVLLTVDSTNKFVSEIAPAAPGLAQVCVAELQNAGRGRAVEAGLRHSEAACACRSGGNSLTPRRRSRP